MKKIFLSLVLISLFLPVIAFSAVTFTNPLTYATFDELVAAIVSFIFRIAVVVTPLMVLIGAFYLLTAAGDPKKIGTGKTIITYALIGLVIVLLARALIYMIERVIGVK